MSDLQQALALLAQYSPHRAATAPAPVPLYHGSSRVTSGLPEWLVPRVIQAESAGNPRAVSPAGAMGLMQLMPATARRFGVSDPFDPVQNQRAGTEYLAWLYRRYGGSLPLAVAAYHAGEGNVDRYLQGRPSGVGPRTRSYVQQVLGVPLEQQVLRLIGESVESPDVFKDNATDLAPIRDSVNDAIQEISMLTGGYTQTYTLPLVSGQAFYRLALEDGHLGWVRSAWLVNQRRKLEQTDLIALAAEDPRWLTHTGTPWQYSQLGLDTLGVHPRPGSTSDAVELTLVVIPQAYSDENDRVRLLRQWHWAAVHYAVAEYYAGRGDARAAEVHMMAYSKALEPALGYQPHPARVWQVRAQEPSRGVAG